MIIDTDVFIWYMRGNVKARKALNDLISFSISSVTYMELIQGIRNREELASLRKFLSKRNISIIHLNLEISQKATFYMEQYSLSHNLRLADALIAATIFTMGEILLTGNTKHYDPVKEIQTTKFQP